MANSERRSTQGSAPLITPGGYPLTDEIHPPLREMSESESSGEEGLEREEEIEGDDNEELEVDEDEMITLDDHGRISGTSELGLDFSFRVVTGVLEPPAWLLEDCEKVFSSESFWLGAEESPRSSMERLARDIFAFHTTGVKFESGKSGVEWWVQVRKSDAKPHPPITFHWDKDEDLIDEFELNVHPQISTVTYLSGTGAPTVVLDKRTDIEYGKLNKEPAKEGLVSWPETGKHISFDGRFLHGATPELAVPTDSTYRVTFLANIWLDYHPMDLERFPESAETELGLNQTHIPTDFTNIQSPEKFLIDPSAETTTLSLPFGMVKGEHLLTLKLPRTKPANSSSLLVSYQDGVEPTIKAKPKKKKKKEEDVTEDLVMNALSGTRRLDLDDLTNEIVGADKGKKSANRLRTLLRGMEKKGLVKVTGSVVELVGRPKKKSHK